MSMSSHSWKLSLEHQARILEELMGGHRQSDATTVRLEETVVVGCYAIRRLINGFLLPECHRNRPVTLSAFPRLPHNTPQLGDEPLRLRYNLEAGHPEQHDPLFLCHQVLQNCVFEPWLTGEDLLNGIYVTSDHHRKIALYGIGLGTLHDLFHQLGTSA